MNIYLSHQEQIWCLWSFPGIPCFSKYNIYNLTEVKKIPAQSLSRFWNSKVLFKATVRVHPSAKWIFWAYESGNFKHSESDAKTKIGTQRIFLCDALVPAAFICNRVASAGIPRDKTPHALWTGRKPDLVLLRVFGSSCWYHARREQAKKLGDRGSPAILIGYAANQKACKLWDDVNQKDVDSRDVLFD